jgi:predicted sugar kinase
VLARVPFPRAWRVLLIFDPAETGVHGAEEATAFATLPDFPESETADLTRRVLLGALPALAEEDFKGFCDQVGYLQKRMGAYFAPMQGGAYVSAAVAAALKGLAADGVIGLGQSSWGPTGFAFASSEAEGERLLTIARERAGSAELRFELAKGRNEPAAIETR